MQKFNTDALNNLSPEEREWALEMLKEIAAKGESDLLNELKYGDFDEIPVDIDTFLDDDDYLGKGLWERDPVTGERRCTLFPYWRATLKLGYSMILLEYWAPKVLSNLSIKTLWTKRFIIDVFPTPESPKKINFTFGISMLNIVSSVELFSIKVDIYF